MHHPTATAGMEKHIQHQQLNTRGFDKLESLSGEEDQWVNPWKIKTAVSGMNGETAEILDAAEADGVRNLKEILKEDAIAEANKEETRVKAKRELHREWRLR